MSYKERFAKKIRQFERKHVPNLRSKKVYKRLKFIILVPMALMLLATDYLKEKLFKTNPENPQRDLILSNMVAGWANLAFTDPKVEELAKKRADICASCPFATFVGGLHTVVVDNKTTQVRGLKCSKCGCPLSAKIRSPHDSCPLNKW